MHRPDHDIDQDRDQLHCIFILRRIADDLFQPDRSPVLLFLGPPFHLFLIQSGNGCSETIEKHVDQKQCCKADNTGSRPTVVHFVSFLQIPYYLKYFINIPFPVPFVKKGLKDTFYVSSSRLTINALFTLRMISPSRWHTLSFRRFLSIVRSCSSRTTESLSISYIVAFNSICVGSFALFILEVIAAQITVGLCLLPTSF